MLLIRLKEKRKTNWSFCWEKEILCNKLTFFLPFCGKDENSLGKQKISIYIKLMCILFSSSRLSRRQVSSMKILFFFGSGLLTSFVITCNWFARSLNVWTPVKRNHKEVCQFYVILPKSSRKYEANIFKINKKNKPDAQNVKMEDARHSLRKHKKRNNNFIHNETSLRVLYMFLYLHQSLCSDGIFWNWKENLMEFCSLHSFSKRFLTHADNFFPFLSSAF